MTAMGQPEHIDAGEAVALFRELLERSPIASLVLRSDHTIRFVNAELEQLFGYSREEVFGRPYEDLFPERLRAALHERLEEFFRDTSREPIGFRPDFIAVRKDGSEFPMQYVAMPVESRLGLWVVVTIFDRTAEREAAERIRILNRAFLTLARMNQAVGRASSGAEVFDGICRVAVEDGGFLGAWVGQAGADGLIEPVVQRGSVSSYISGLAISTDPADPSSTGPTGTSLREGRVVYVEDFATDPLASPWAETAAKSGIHSSVCLPLRRSGRVVAVLTLYASATGPWDGQSRELLEGLAENVSLALSGFDRARRLEEVSAQRGELLQRLVSAEESERHRIAADLHDESVQALAAVELRLSSIETSARTRAPELEPRVAAVRQLVGSTMHSLRELMFDLEPAEADTMLADALREAAAQVFLDSRLQWRVRVEERPLERVRRTQALRIVKEALINIRKHASATVAEVEARPDATGMLFRVRDNGSGLSAAEGIHPGHRGLQTMRERAELAGGWFRASPAAGGGTEVEWWLPAEDQATN